LSFAYALDEPDRWRDIPEAERSARGMIGTDSCVIDHEEFFIRGRIVIPVQVLGDQDGQWDKNAWKTEAFYQHPLTGFTAP